MKQYGLFLFMAIVAHGNPSEAVSTENAQIDSYNVIWHSPSKDHTGQMPLGNGDIAAGVYAIENDQRTMRSLTTAIFSRRAGLRSRSARTPLPRVSRSGRRSI